MDGFLRRSLAAMLAMALVLAGLPVAHAMPVVATAAVTHQHDASARVIASGDLPHHCDDMAMETAPSSHDDDRQDADRQDTAMPCKCLSCSMCVASFVAPPLRVAAPERRIIPVIYRIDIASLAGIGARIDPGIPILAN